MKYLNEDEFLENVESTLQNEVYDYAERDDIGSIATAINDAIAELVQSNIQEIDDDDYESEECEFDGSYTDEEEELLDLIISDGVIDRLESWLSDEFGALPLRITYNGDGMFEVEFI